MSMMYRCTVHCTAGTCRCTAAAAAGERARLSVVDGGGLLQQTAVQAAAAAADDTSRKTFCWWFLLRFCTHHQWTVAQCSSSDCDDQWYLDEASYYYNIILKHCVTCVEWMWSFNYMKLSIMSLSTAFNWCLVLSHFFTIFVSSISPCPVRYVWMSRPYPLRVGHCAAKGTG
jgi:hypothetical protein